MKVTIGFSSGGLKSLFLLRYESRFGFKSQALTYIEVLKSESENYIEALKIKYRFFFEAFEIGIKIILKFLEVKA